ncbi:MAG: NADPH-dependent FMN reductase [Leptospirales bacterium]
MARIVGIAGSLRAGSFNAALLRAAAALAPAGSSMKIGTISGIPLYNGDIEATEGIPPQVEALKDQIAAGDGLLMVTPEYNNAMPGVFKNAVDWLSRPSEDILRVFGSRPVAIIGASSGGFGTVLAQNTWLPVFKTLGMKPWFGGHLFVAHAGKVFDSAGEMIDENAKISLRQFIHGFVDFIDGQSGGSIKP